jgi:hypothetical protein
MELLKSKNPNKRYDACEELRVSQSPLPQEAILALDAATKDANSDVADAAQRALAIQSQSYEQEQNAPTTTKEELWATIFPLSILLSLGSAPLLVRMFLILGFGGWVLEGAEAILGSIMETYLLVHPLFVIGCPIISWYLHKKKSNTKAIAWAIVPNVGLLIVTILYYLTSAQHPAWG